MPAGSPSSVPAARKQRQCCIAARSYARLSSECARKLCSNLSSAHCHNAALHHNPWCFAVPSSSLLQRPNRGRSHQGGGRQCGPETSRLKRITDPADAGFAGDRSNEPASDDQFYLGPVPGLPGSPCRAQELLGARVDRAWDHARRHPAHGLCRSRAARRGTRPEPRPTHDTRVVAEARSCLTPELSSSPNLTGAAWRRHPSSMTWRCIMRTQNTLETFSPELRRISSAEI